MGVSKLFVYGTLMRGFASPPGRRLEAGSELLGRGSIQAKLYQVDPAYPGAVASERAEDEAPGELLLLKEPEATLAELDEYEGGEYARRLAEVRLEDGSSATAWAYFYERPVDPASEIKAWPPCPRRS